MIQQTINHNEIANPKENFELIDSERKQQAFIKKEAKQKENMIQPDNDNSELESLREQFGLLNAKLDKQRILCNEIINDSIKGKLSHIEKWYHNRFRISLVTAPIVSTIFLFMYIDRGIAYWSFSLCILLVALLEYLLNRRSYKKLNIRMLPSLSMTEATENITRHKQMRTKINRIMAIPLILLITWTILIASNFTWKPFIIILTVFSIAISIFFGIRQERANRKRLEDILKMIKKLRE